MMLALQIHIQINAIILKPPPLSFSISLPTKFHLKFKFFFVARFIFPTLSNDKHNTHTFEVTSKP